MNKLIIIKLLKKIAINKNKIIKQRKVNIFQKLNRKFHL